MRRWIITLGAVAAIGMIAAGCTQQTASAPQPAAKAAAGEPTKASTQVAAPTTSAKKVEFPTKPITILVGQSAGGAVDTTHRMVAEGLKRNLGQAVNVENKVGAGGQVAMTALARSKPDGYTLGASNLPSTHITYLLPENQAAFGRADLVQVANIVDEYSGIAVMADSPYKTMQDLLAASKSGTRINIADQGVYSIEWFIKRKVEALSGAKIGDVNFSGGAEAMAALMGHKVDGVARALSGLKGQYDSKEIRVLAMSGPKRNPDFPDVPTFQELGISFSLGATRGLSAPKGTPKEVVDILGGAIKELCEGTGPNAVWFQDEMKKQGMPIEYMGPDAYSKYWDEMEAIHKQILKDLGTLK